jgi:flagellar hook-length control protein FliK
VVVVDLRRQAAPPELEAAPQRGGEERETGSAKDFGRVLASFSRDTASAGESPRPAAGGQSAPGLWRSVQERLVPEIVQRTGIILRDGGEGEIRLVLRPEHLGSVRIRLHLGESSLEGRIVVDNYNVKELLEANLEQLKTALRQEGYASANIDVSVSGDETRREASRNETGPLTAAAGSRAEEFERAAPLAWEAGLGFTTVNLFV